MCLPCTYVQKNCTDLSNHVPLGELQAGTQHPQSMQEDTREKLVPRRKQTVLLLTKKEVEAGTEGQANHSGLLQPALPRVAQNLQWMTPTSWYSIRFPQDTREVQRLNGHREVHLTFCTLKYQPPRTVCLSVSLLQCVLARHRVRKSLALTCRSSQ